MSRRRKRKQFLKVAAWCVTLGAVMFAALLVYCYRLFTDDIARLMEQKPHSHPSVIFSDIYFVKKGAIFQDTFLTERLNDLRITYQQKDGRIEWSARHFDYPEFLLESGSPARPSSGDPVSVKIEDGRIAEIKVADNDVEEVALEPTPVAQLSGAAKEIRDYVPWDKIPANLRFAVIAIEDQRFLEHHGFDPRSLARALWVNMKSGGLSQGGSTLTQQLVKNLLDSSQKTLFRKLRELILAVMLEINRPKSEILTKYLNEVYFGQVGSFEVHGVVEAAKYFFNKQLDHLTTAEMAFMAGVIRGPAVYSPYKRPKLALDRKDTVLRKMAELGYITDVELREAMAQKLIFTPPSLVGNRAPYFVDFVKSQVIELLSEREPVGQGKAESKISTSKGKELSGDLSSKGYRIFTTIDLPLQRRADQAVATTIRELEARHKIARPLRLEGVLVSADPDTGFVKALVGGRSYAETTFNRVLNMKRQVGSTFKPIAYLAALIKGSDPNGIPYTGAYMVDDEPWTHKYQNGKMTWTPHNYEKTFRGRITLREAFANSINIPMAKIGTEVGLDRVVEVAEKLGVTQTPLPKVPSLVLGSVDLYPMELLQAYSTMANRGRRVELSTIRGIESADSVPIARFNRREQDAIEPKYLELLNTLLASVVREGTAKALPSLGYNKPAYGKTGTTSFYRDAWFAGFSQGLVTVAWTGFDELKTPDLDDEAATRKFKAPALLTGAGSALPMWARFYAAARPAMEIEPEPEPSSELERHKIDKTTGLRARSSCPSELVYEENFLPDTAPSADCNVH